MQARLPQTSDATSSSLSDGNGNGAVAEVYLNTSADVESILPSATTVYKGFGNILDLQFVHEYNYTTQE